MREGPNRAQLFFGGLTLLWRNSATSSNMEESSKSLKSNLDQKPGEYSMVVWIFVFDRRGIQANDDASVKVELELGFADNLAIVNGHTRRPRRSIGSAYIHAA